MWNSSIDFHRDEFAHGNDASDGVIVPSKERCCPLTIDAAMSLRMRQCSSDGHYANPSGEKPR